MRKEETIIVSNKTFNVKQLSATDAVEFQVELLSLINKGDKLSMVGSDEGTTSLDQFLELFSKVDPKKLVKLIKFALHNNVCVTDENKSPIDIDNMFSGDLMGLYELFAKVIIINYKDFFLKLVSGDIGRIAGEIQNSMK